MFTSRGKLTKINKSDLEQSSPMDCSRCGLCCEKTGMLLSIADIERLERMGCNREKFVRFDGHGFVRLRNHHGFCVFYDVERCRCRVYGHRPLGCRVYPVIFSEREGLVLDDLCPMGSTVSKMEFDRKGKRLMLLLQRIDAEAMNRRSLKGVE